MFDIFDNGSIPPIAEPYPGPLPQDILNINCGFDISKFFKLHAKPDFALNLYIENLMNTAVWGLNGVAFHIKRSR